MAQSIVEAEFIVAIVIVNHASWLRKILIYINLEQNESTKIFVDNQAAISISNNPIFHGKTKHFNIKLFFLREVQKNEDVLLVHCKFEVQIVDMFTKPFPTSRYGNLRARLGVYSS